MDVNGWTPLHLFAESRFPSRKSLSYYLRLIGAEAEIAQILVDAGSDIEARDVKHAASLLHIASLLRSPETLQALLDAGADFEARLDDGGTPLHNAASSGSAENVQALIESGANIEARNDKD